jgi:hypothetical protein
LNTVKENYNFGFSVTKNNAIDTLNEMKKFCSLAEAKQAFLYSKDLAKEVNEELVGGKIRLLLETLRPVLKSQVNSIFNKNNFAIDNSADDESDEQE